MAVGCNRYARPIGQPSTERQTSGLERSTYLQIPVLKALSESPDSSRSSSSIPPGPQAQTFRSEENDVAVAKLNHEQTAGDKGPHEDVTKFRVFGHQGQYFVPHEFEHC